MSGEQRARRQMPRRGRDDYDAHIPLGHQGHQWMGKDWLFQLERYQRWERGGFREWMTGDDADTELLYEQLSAFLSDALGPCSEIGTGVITDGRFDAAAPAEQRRSCLLSIGWPEGRLPTSTVLIGHIIDRLEYWCARDVAPKMIVGFG